MKLKNKISALTVALAMGAMALVGCGGDNPPAPDPGPVDIYYHVYPNSGQFTVSSFAEQGYKENDPVTFTVTPNEDYEVVSVVGSRGVGTLTPTAGQYSFSMPAGNVNLTITVREVEHYALSHTGDLQVDGDAVQFVLTLGSDVQPASSWTLEATSGASHVSIDATTKKVTALSATEEGEVVEFAAKVGGEVVGTDSAEVLPSLRSTIANAIADAWGDGTTAFANNNSKGSEAKSTKEYIITGKVMAFGSLKSGSTTQEAIIDDGTGLLDLQCLSVSATKPCPFKLGDVVEVKNYLQNHYGLLEISCFPDTVKVVNQAITPISSFPALDADGYVSALDALSVTDAPRYIKDCSLVADGAPEGTSLRFNVEGIISDKYNNGKMAASRGFGDKELVCEAEVPYAFTGYLLNYNTSSKYSNLFPVSQELLSAESVAISNKAEVELMLINTEVQLAYTTVPAHAGKVVTWESSDEGVVTVVDGLVSAVGAGTATVTLTVDGHSDTVEIEVSASITPVTSASFSKASEEVTIGSTLDLRELLTVGPEGANEKGVWSVEEGKSGVLTVNDGVVTPVGKGTATVSVHYATNDVTATISVEVKVEHGKDPNDPFDTAEAHTEGMKLDHQGTSTEAFYIEGVVTKNTTKTTGKIFAELDGGAFVLYMLPGTDQQKADLVVGSKVIVHTKLYRFSSTIENPKDEGEIVSIDNSAVTLIEITSDNPLFLTVGQADVANPFVAYPTALEVVPTMSSSDANVVSIVDGKIHAVAKGKAVLTATAGEVSTTLSVEVLEGGQVVKSVEFDATKQGYVNEQEVTSWASEEITISFSKGTNRNAPKYYNSGTAIRCYGSNTITVSTSSGNIKGITLTFGTSDGSNEITVDKGTFVSPAWSGEESAVVFTIGGTSGNRRIMKISISYVA
jgi:hypothetical protein